MKRRINLFLLLSIFSINVYASNIILSGHIGKEIKNVYTIDKNERCYEFELSIQNNSKNDTSFWINRYSWDKHIIQNKKGVIFNSNYERDGPDLYKIIQGGTIKFKGVIKFKNHLRSNNGRMKFGFILINANEYSYPKRNDKKFIMLEDIIMINWKKENRVVLFEIELPTLIQPR